MKVQVIMVFLACILSVTACKKKAADAVAVTDSNGNVVDPAAPVFGTAMTFTGTTSTSTTVTWGAATDTVTAQALLSYKVVRSGASNITTVTDAETNGTLVMDWTVNTLTTSLSSLTSAKKYYISVLVKDADGNKVVATSNFSTLCSGKIIFLATVSSGSFGGASGADTACNAQKPTGFSGSTFKAMLSDNTTRKPCNTSLDCRSATTGRLDWVFTSAVQDVCTSDYSTKIGSTNSIGILTADLPLSTTATTTFVGVDIYWGPSLQANSCAYWSSTASTGNAGNANLTGQDFFAYTASASCAAAGTVYCVQQ